MEGLLPLVISYGVRIVGVLVVFWIANKIAAWIKTKTVSELTKREFDATLAKFLGSVARYGILIMTALSCLGLFGIETTSFAAVIGAAGLAIGLAFQGTLSNVSAGVMLVALRPFKTGDVITAAGVTGMVMEIGLLTCELRDGAGLRVIVPNSAMFGATIQHVTSDDGIRRVDINVGAEYPADIDATRAALTAAVALVDAPILKDRPNGPFLAGLGASSVDWQLRLYCKPADYWAVWEAGTRAAKKALDDAGIGIPYNTVDVNIVSGQS